jgi:hypothetical protein
MGGAAKIDRTRKLGIPEARERNLMIATFAERLNDAKKHADYLKSWFKEHAAAAIDEHGELDITKCREHLNKLLSLSNAGKTLTAEEEGLVMEYAQVGRAYCTICGKWTGEWMSLLDESLYPPLCNSCAEKVLKSAE